MGDVMWKLMEMVLGATGQAIMFGGPMEQSQAPNGVKSGPWNVRGMFGNESVEDCVTALPSPPWSGTFAHTESGALPARSFVEMGRVVGFVSIIPTSTLKPSW